MNCVGQWVQLLVPREEYWKAEGPKRNIEAEMVCEAVGEGLRVPYIIPRPDRHHAVDWLNRI
jgi:hypothetical protein